MDFLSIYSVKVFGNSEELEFFLNRYKSQKAVTSIVYPVNRDFLVISMYRYYINHITLDLDNFNIRYKICY